jgi:uncharacterized protein YidB (DUF937 family)
MDIMKLGTQLLMSKLGGGTYADSGAVQNALGSLLGNGEAPDIGSLLSGLQSNGLGDIAKSWLGDGDNAPISSDQLKNIVDGNKLSELASVLGTDEGSVLSGLQEAMPQMVDKASSGGSLLESIGGISGVAKFAKGLLG